MHNKKALIALKKARTSLDNVINMASDDVYCIDIIQQNLSVIWLLKSANISLLSNHLDTHVKESALSGDRDDIEDKLEEILKIVRLSGK